MTPDDTAIWSRRAARLREAFDESFAKPAESAVVRGTPVLSVTIGGTPCAIRVRDCAGVIASAPVSAVPSQVRGFLGFTASGGVVRPVYDLASLLGLPAGAGARPPLVLAAAHAVAFAVEAIEGHDALDGEERELADFVSVGGAQRRLVALGPVMDAIAREAREIAARRSGQR